MIKKLLITLLLLLALSGCTSFNYVIDDRINGEWIAAKTGRHLIDIEKDECTLYIQNEPTDCFIKYYAGSLFYVTEDKVNIYKFGFEFIDNDRALIYVQSEQLNIIIPVYRKSAIELQSM